MSGIREVTVSSKDGSFTQQIKTRAHEGIADEPEALGGHDQGPDPYEWLLGSLGACMAITVNMYAQKKNWHIDEIKVTLRHQKVHAKDCADCEEQSGYIDEIQKQVLIIGDLSEEQMDRLLEISNKCPVHRTLSNGVKLREIKS